MVFSKWLICCVVLNLCLSSWSLEDSQHDITEVKCSQGLSDCSALDVFPHASPEDTADVKKLNATFGVACEDGKKCLLYLVIDINVDLDLEKGDNSGADEEEFSEETKSTKAFVTVCYNVAQTLPTCKKVEFTVNDLPLTHQNQPKISLTITNPDGFPYRCTIYIYAFKNQKLKQTYVAPSETNVCSRKLYQNALMCQVPTVRSKINLTREEMKLVFGGRNKTIPSLCIQYEKNGSCQESSTIGKQMIVPLYSLAPCICFQSWDKDDQSLHHFQYCPFQNKSDFPADLQQKMWKNVSINVHLQKLNDKSTMLLWNVSAPCRLEGDVFLCHKTNLLVENKRRQKLENGIWTQNSKGMWEKKGGFQNVDGFSQCIMVKVKGIEHTFELTCPDEVLVPGGRWHWSVLIVAVILLVCIALLVSHYHHDCVKKWVWSWHRGGFVKVGRRGHVVLMSPPDVDDNVSESVCKLGELLCSKGFSVTVEQWCRKEQSNLGPLPWLHSVLLKGNSMDTRLLLALTPSILDGTANLTDMHTNLFTATLFLMESNKEVRNCCVLVQFDYERKQRHSKDRSLPPFFHGLPFFSIPSQTQPLLTELSVIKQDRRAGEWT